MKRNRTILRLLVFAVLISFVAAAGVTAGDKGATGTITGSVNQTDKGWVIAADDGDYLVAGKDISALMGKKIKATGTVSEDKDGVKILNVTLIEAVN